MVALFGFSIDRRRQLKRATGKRPFPPSPFRSDNLTGLIHGNPSPENTTPPAGIRYRPFE